MCSLEVPAEGMAVDPALVSRPSILVVNRLKILKLLADLKKRSIREKTLCKLYLSAEAKNEEVMKEMQRVKEDNNRLRSQMFEFFEREEAWKKDSRKVVASVSTQTEFCSETAVDDFPALGLSEDSGACSNVPSDSLSLCSSDSSRSKDSAVTRSPPENLLNSSGVSVTSSERNMSQPPVSVDVRPIIGDLSDEPINRYFVPEVTPVTVSLPLQTPMQKIKSSKSGIGRKPAAHVTKPKKVNLSVSTASSILVANASRNASRKRTSKVLSSSRKMTRKSALGEVNTIVSQLGSVVEETGHTVMPSFSEKLVKRRRTRRGKKAIDIMTVGSAVVTVAPVEITHNLFSTAINAPQVPDALINEPTKSASKPKQKPRKQTFPKNPSKSRTFRGKTKTSPASVPAVSEENLRENEEFLRDVFGLPDDNSQGFEPPELQKPQQEMRLLSTSGTTHSNLSVMLMECATEIVAHSSEPIEELGNIDEMLNFGRSHIFRTVSPLSEPDSGVDHASAFRDFSLLTGTTDSESETGSELDFDVDELLREMRSEFAGYDQPPPSPVE